MQMNQPDSTCVCGFGNGRLHIEVRCVRLLFPTISETIATQMDFNISLVVLYQQDFGISIHSLMSVFITTSVTQVTAL